MEIKINKTMIKLVKGDITDQETEAVVNAANPTLLGGKGVDGAIHSKGGPQILARCKEIRREKGDLPTGEAVITTAGNLKAEYVIHTVGPVWQGGNNYEDELLAKAYVNSLKKAAENGIKTISFPSLSTGAYGFPTERAALISCRAVGRFLQYHDFFTEIRFVLFSDRDYAIYLKAWENTLKGS
ncbi:MAG: O-acetyl-ADP-ribose deacetylase [Peptococcaceae bacterium]